MAFLDSLGKIVNKLSLAVDANGPNTYIPSLATSSLMEFYDDVVYWEIAKNTNRFFVTFEKGEYAPKNNKQESIATMEISHPLVNNNSSSNFRLSASLGGSRNNVSALSFIGEEEELAGDYNHHNYNGFIPITEIKGTRFWQSTITSSIHKIVSATYEIKSGSSDDITTTVNKEISASYFYPFSGHQLSVLRSNPTLITNLDKDTELPGYTGEKGFVAIPFQTHRKIKDNIDFYLEKAGLLNKTTTTKAPRKGR